MLMARGRRPMEMSVYAKPKVRSAHRVMKLRGEFAYAAGGARGAICENTGLAPGALSSGKEIEATGLRTAMQRPASGWMGA